MKSRFKRTSYLLIDNTASGGIKEEYDLKTCVHCQWNQVKIFRPPYTHSHIEDCNRFGCEYEQYYCWKCDGVLCLTCGRSSSGECKIYEKEKEKILKEYFRMKARERF